MKCKARERTIHARLIVGVVSENHFIVLSPEGELLDENYNDLSSFLWVRDRPADLSLPYGIGADRVRDFGERPTQGEFDQLVEESQVIVARLQSRDLNSHDGPPGLASPSLPMAAPPALVPLAGGASIPEGPARASGPPQPGRPSGLPLKGGLGALAAALGHRDQPVGGEPQSSLIDEDKRADQRVFPVQYDGAGQRFRPFRDALLLTEQVQFPDWPVPGVQTARWCMQFVSSKAGSPTAWHQMWKSNGRLQDTDPLVLFHESQCRIAEVAACYDQADAGSLACLELVYRQIQVIEEKLKHKFTDEHDANLDYYLMSGSSSRSHLCICPALSEWIAEEAKKETAVMKERRKAREERSLAKPKR